LLKFTAIKIKPKIMPTDCISYQNSGYFSTLIHDYLDQKPDLKPLYNNFPTLENFEKQIIEKQKNFNNKNRIPLVSVLKEQYATITFSARKYFYDYNRTSIKSF